MKGSSGADTILEPVRERGSTGKTWVGETRASVMIADRTTLSIAKAGELVGVTRRTIYNWIAGGKVEYVRDGRRFRADLRRYTVARSACRRHPAGYARNLGKTSQHPQRSERRAAPAAGTALRRASPVPWSGAPPHAATGASAPSAPSRCGKRGQQVRRWLERRGRRAVRPLRTNIALPPFGKAKRAVIRLPTSVHDDRICCSTSRIAHLYGDPTLSVSRCPTGRRQEFARPRRGHPPVEVSDQVSGLRPARRFPSPRRGARCLRCCRRRPHRPAARRPAGAGPSGPGARRASRADWPEPAGCGRHQRRREPTAAPFGCSP